MNIPSHLKYTKTDEWFDPASGKVGLTDYAQSQLSDIVFVEILVSEGETIEAGKPIASVESVKAAAEAYAPVSGKVIAINNQLPDRPELLNSDPYGEAWLIRIEGGDASALLDAAAYEKHCAEREH
ncbi:MAG: glycine cleavage system protein GcvH [Anaerolineales bacterium]